MITKTKHLVLTLLLVFSISVSAPVSMMSFAATPSNSTAVTTTSANATVATAKNSAIIKRNGKLYYKDPSTGIIRKKTGFFKSNGYLYYIGEDGTVTADKTFKVGDYKYRAFIDGRIATGVYKWCGKRYYSNPKNGRCFTVNKTVYETSVKWNGNTYYVQKGGSLATDRPVVIDNKPYMADSSGICKRIDIVAPNNRVLKVAQNQVGIKTGKKYWRWYFGTKFRDTDLTPWCACFTAWCYNQADQYGRIKRVRNYGNLGYVPSYTRFANRYNKWVKRSNAKGGDLIIFGRGSRHIGVVERVYKGYVFTIEGNSGPTAVIGCKKPGAVTRRVYKLYDEDIKGIFRP